MNLHDRRPPIAADLYGELLLAEAPPARLRRALFHGLVVVVIAACAAAWLSEHYHVPIVLMGLLIGLALNFLAADKRTHPGLDFAGTTCLRLGIVLLGTQVTFAQIGGLGPVPFVGIVAIMALVIAAGIVTARLTGQSTAIGLLAGGATAICGASAALALYGVIGRDRVSQAQFTLTLVGISLASALAMSFYPLIAAQLGFTDAQAGFMIGASVHDVAQAIGGGYAVSNEAGEVATIVKLARVALLAPVVAIASLMMARETSQATDGPLPTLRSRLKLPWFILGFLLVVAANSLFAAPHWLTGPALITSKALLLLAVTATAMRSRLDLLLNQGWRGTLPVAAATLASLIAALAFTDLLL